MKKRTRWRMRTSKFRTNMRIALAKKMKSDLALAEGMEERLKETPIISKKNLHELEAEIKELSDQVSCHHDGGN